MDPGEEILTRTNNVNKLRSYLVSIQGKLTVLERSDGLRRKMSRHESSNLLPAQLTKETTEEKNQEIDDLTEMMMRCLENADVEDFIVPIFFQAAESRGRAQIQFLKYYDPYITDPRHGYGYSDFFFMPLSLRDEKGVLLYKLGRTKTFWNLQDIDLAEEPKLVDPIEIIFPENYKWLRVFIKVYDDDNGSFKWARTITKIVNLRRTPAGKAWIERTVKTSDDEYAATLSIRYRLLECDECKFCSEQGPPCAVCAENYYPVGNCTKFCESNPIYRYNCTPDGEKKCLLKNREGEKCENCIAEYYERDCSKHCRVSDNYTCSGVGDKVCEANYYPQGECTAFCVENVSHTCNDVGGKVCKPYHYPDGDCSRYCRPVEGKYTCDQITGYKVCTEKNASLENGCKKRKSNVLVIISGVGAVIAVLVMLTVLFVYRYRKKKNLKDMAGQQDTIYSNTLADRHNHEIMEVQQPKPSSSRYEDVEVKITTPHIHFATNSDVFYSASEANEDLHIYSDLGPENTNGVFSTWSEKADVMYSNPEMRDLDVMHSTLGGGVSRQSCSEIKESDAVYSTLEEEDVIHSETNGESTVNVYSTLNRNEALISTTERKDSDTDYSTLNRNNATNPTLDARDHLGKSASPDFKESTGNNLANLYSTPQKDIPHYSIPEKRIPPRSPETTQPSAPMQQDLIVKQDEGDVKSLKDDAGHYLYSAVNK